MLTMRIPSISLCRTVLPALFLFFCAWAEVIALAPLSVDSHDQVIPDGRSIISLAVHGIPGKSFPSIDIEPIPAPDLNNVAASALYKIDARHAVGLEVGRENYPQQFHVKYGSTTVHYQQNWTGWYYALAYENVSEHWESIKEAHHFFRIAVGGNRTGPMLRLSGGVHWELNSLFSLVAGFDLSATMYRADDLWHSTQKVGLRFGLNVDI